MTISEMFFDWAGRRLWADDLDPATLDAEMVAQVRVDWSLVSVAAPGWRDTMRLTDDDHAGLTWEIDLTKPGPSSAMATIHREGDPAPVLYAVFLAGLDAEADARALALLPMDPEARARVEASALPTGGPRLVCVRPEGEPAAREWLPSCRHLTLYLAAAFLANAVQAVE